jgi:hypothetical protein
LLSIAMRSRTFTSIQGDSFMLRASADVMLDDMASPASYRYHASLSGRQWGLALTRDGGVKGACLLRIHWTGPLALVQPLQHGVWMVKKRRTRAGDDDQCLSPEDRRKLSDAPDGGTPSPVKSHANAVISHPVEGASSGGKRQLRNSPERRQFSAAPTHESGEVRSASRTEGKPFLAGWRSKYWWRSRPGRSRPQLSRGLFLDYHRPRLCVIYN